MESTVNYLPCKLTVNSLSFLLVPCDESFLHIGKLLEYD